MSSTLTEKEILEQVVKDNVKFVNMQFIDLFGVVKNITITVEHLEDAFKNGVWFDGSSIEGFAKIHESDMFLKPDPTTYALIPWLNSPEGNTARFICDIFCPDGRPFEGDPRNILKKVLKEAEELGYTYNTGPEFEFFLFKKDNDKLVPLPHDTGGYFDLSMDKAYEVRREMAVVLRKFGIDVERLSHEVSAGQHEINFCYGSALQTADNATTLRCVLKAVAERHGLHATFMPKPIAGINGSAMHVHQSLFKNGENVFFDASDSHCLSPIAKNFIAGQLKHIQGMCAITSPTVNSYKRLAPGYEAPVYVSWAKTNRSALIRVPAFKKEKPKAARIELRCPDPTCNIYLAFAVMLKAGLDGIKNNLQPPESIEDDLYGFDESKLSKFNVTQLPYSLFDAVKYMKKSDLVRDVFGEATYSKYVSAKIAEWDEFRLQVTQWELDRYLELY